MSATTPACLTAHWPWGPRALYPPGSRGGWECTSRGWHSCTSWVRFTGAAAHHFCFREKGEEISKGCRGIASAYIIEYIMKNFDAIRKESLALDEKRKRE